MEEWELTATMALRFLKTGPSAVSSLDSISTTPSPQGCRSRGCRDRSKRDHDSGSGRSWERHGDDRDGGGRSRNTCVLRFVLATSKDGS